MSPESSAFTVLLGVLAALPALSIDISAPTLPLLPRAIGTTTFAAGLTISLFMAGFALGQACGGIASDRYGRRPVLLTALACFSAAGLACATATSGSELVIDRLVQGMGAGACSVLAFTMVQDLFEGEAARRKRSYVVVVFGAVPVFAPSVGAIIVDLIGWRGVYQVLALAGCLIFGVIWLGLAESKPTTPPSRPAMSRINRRRQFAGPFNDPEFVTLTFVNALGYSCIFAYIAGSPLVIMGQLGRPASVFAAVFAATALALTAGSWASGHLCRRNVGAVSLLDPSLFIMAIASLTLAVAAATLNVTAITMVPLLLAVLFARGMAGPNLMHLAMQRVTDRAGMASACIGIAQLLAGAASSAVVAVLLPGFGAVAVAVPMAALSAAALICWLVYRRPAVQVAE